MKSREQSLFAGLLQKQNRTQLAIILGAAAMLLILFSELFSTPAKPASSGKSSQGGTSAGSMAVAEDAAEPAICAPVTPKL